MASSTTLSVGQSHHSAPNSDPDHLRPDKPQTHASLLWFTSFACRAKTDVYGAQTHLSETRSGGRQSAVVWESHLQERFRKVAGECRRGAANAGAVAVAKPRGLTRTAPVHVVRLPSKNRRLRCTNASFGNQERRASVRRGVEIALARTVPQSRGRVPTGCCERRCSRRSETTVGLCPPLLFARLPADGIATFPMHERTCTRSGGRQSAVAVIPHSNNSFGKYQHSGGGAFGKMPGLGLAWRDKFCFPLSRRSTIMRSNA